MYLTFAMHNLFSILSYCLTRHLLSTSLLTTTLLDNLYVFNYFPTNPGSKLKTTSTYHPSDEYS